SEQNLFTVTGAGDGTTQITVKDSANNSASFYVSVSTASSNTFTINLPAQQNVAVAFGAISGSGVSGGTVKFPTANAGYPYPAGTVVTVTLSSGVPPGFGYTPPGAPESQVFGITFNSNNTIPSATLSSLPSMTVNVGLGGNGLQGEVLAPPTPFGPANCQIFGGTGMWTV